MGLAKEADSYAEHADELNAVALTQQASPEAARAIPSRHFRQSIGTASDRMVNPGQADRTGDQPALINLPAVLDLANRAKLLTGHHNVLDRGEPSDSLCYGLAGHPAAPAVALIS